LSVARIQLPAYLDRTELVFSPAENRLEVHDVHLWLEPLGKAVTRVFSQDLAQRLGTGRIAIAPSLDVYRDAVQVQVEVIRFDGAVGREVTLRARWRLSRLADGETLFVGERTVSVPLADAPGQQGYVKGMSLALDQLSEAVAQDVRRLNKRP
ncbi:MAG: PqiC family protein, partial [Puniceicoccales bacterium]|nr:PqiC family protein [Puniceicoccales bacterium]